MSEDLSNVRCDICQMLDTMKEEFFLPEDSATIGFLLVAEFLTDEGHRRMRIVSGEPSGEALYACLSRAYVDAAAGALADTEDGYVAL